MKKPLLEYNLTDLELLMADIGQPKFRAKQILDGVYAGKVLSEISNLPKSLIGQLAGYGGAVTIQERFVSKDGTIKYLFRLSDGNLIEGVLMTYSYGRTLCISTQVGCRMDCAFCASGLEGLIRNLTTAEMLSEVILVNADIGGGNIPATDGKWPSIRQSANADDAANVSVADDQWPSLQRSNIAKRRAVTNVVLMGSGEPLDNYDNVTQFLRLITAPFSLNISIRNISLSTCGIPDKIKRLADDGFSVTMTISLHSADDTVRSKIMPVNKAYGIAEVKAATKYYFDKTGRRVIYEYALIADINDNADAAKKMAEFAKGQPCHVNLIRLNPVKEKGLRGTSKEKTKEFLKILEDNGISVTLRRIMGADIEGACGQLRTKFVGDNPPKNIPKYPISHLFEGKI